MANESIRVKLRDYLSPGGIHKYETLAPLLEQYHKDGKSFVLVSVPGSLMGTNYPDDDTGYPFSDMAGEYYKTANDLLSGNNGKTFD